MAQVINFSQYFQTQIFESQLSSVGVLLSENSAKLEKLVLDIQKTNKALQTQTATQSNTNKSIKSTNTNISKLSTLEKERSKIEKQLNTTLAKGLVLGEKNNKTLQKGKAAIQQRNQVLRNQAKLERLNTEEGKKLNKVLQRQRAEMRKASGGGNGLVKAFRGVLTGFVGITAVIYGAIRAIGGIIKINKDFEKALSSLSAITGLTGDELKFFEQRAKETSKSTLQSATDIVKAYELVGSIRPELLKNKEALAEVTEQAIILSEATGGKLGLEQSAKVTAGALSQFSLEADQASRVINSFAAGAKYGSATSDLVSESIEKFGAVADDANISLEQSVALTETLADKQLLGAESGTALRGTILRLQAAGLGYASGQFNINDALTEAKQKADSYATAVEKDAYMQKVFGQRNILTGSILLNNIDRFEELTDSVTGTTVALEQQAIQNDNLAANWKKLVNRIQNAFISGNINGFLNKIVKGLLNLSKNIVEFRNSFVENFNDLIRQSAIFRAIFVAVTGAIKTNFKGMKQSALIVVDAFVLVAKAIKDALTGNWDEISENVSKQLNKIKNRTIDIGKSFVGLGKDIINAFDDNNIDQYLIKIIDVDEATKNLGQTISDTQQISNFSSELQAKTLEEIEMLQQKALINQKKRYTAGEISKEEYEKNIYDIEQKYLLMSLGASDITAEKKIDIQNKILDNKIKNNEEEIKNEQATQKWLREESEKTRKAKIDDQIAIAEVAIEKEKEKLLAGEISSEQLAKRAIEIEIEKQEALLNIENLTAEERFKIQQALTDAKISLAEKEKEDKQKIANELIDIAANTFGVIGQFQQNELDRLEQRYQYELELAGDNEQKKMAIEKKYDAERKELQRKKANTDKLLAIFNAAINTAQAITAALTIPVVGIALAAVIGALGAAQIAAIVSAPIPKFKHGTPKLKEDTIAEFGEAGREIVKEPNKMPYIATRPTIDYLPKGTEIIPNYETEKYLRESGGITPEQFNKFTEGQSRIEKAVKNIPVNITNIDERGINHITIEGNKKITWLGKYKHR